MSDATFSALIAVAVLLVSAGREVLVLWIRASYRWKNGTAAKEPDPEV